MVRVIYDDVGCWRVSRRFFEAMRKDGLVSPDAVHVFDHVARTLWPRTPDAQLRLAGRFHGVLAQDGLSIEV